MASDVEQIGREYQAAMKRILALEKALEESVKLQSHYANLLNMHDGGRRLQFRSPEEWIARLQQTGTIRP